MFSCHCLHAESQWEVPPEYQQAYGSVAATRGAAVDTEQSATESNLDSEESALAATKRSVDQTELEPRETHQPSKRHTGPFGAWTTVAVYERTEEERPKESQEGRQGDEEKGGDSSEDDDGREEKLKFEEKTVSGLGRSEGGTTAMVAGAFKGFGFKKRAGNRPQIRQLKTNDL